MHRSDTYYKYKKMNISINNKRKNSVSFTPVDTSKNWVKVWYIKIPEMNNSFTVLLPNLQSPLAGSKNFQECDGEMKQAIFLSTMNLLQVLIYKTTHNIRTFISIIES